MLNTLRTRATRAITARLITPPTTRPTTPRMPHQVHWTANGLGRTMTTTLDHTPADVVAAISHRYQIHPDCIRIL